MYLPNVSGRLPSLYGSIKPISSSLPSVSFHLTSYSAYLSPSVRPPASIYLLMSSRQWWQWRTEDHSTCSLCHRLSQSALCVCVCVWEQLQTSGKWVQRNNKHTHTNSSTLLLTTAGRDDWRCKDSFKTVFKVRTTVSIIKARCKKGLITRLNFHFFQLIYSAWFSEDNIVILQAAAATDLMMEEI